MLQTNVILAENIKTHNLCTVTFLVKNRAVYGIIWKSIVEQFRPQKKICRMRIACWIPKATNIYIYIYTHTHAHTHAHTHTHTHTHTGCVILIAFPLQQRLHELASMLPYTHIACLVKSHIHFVILLCSFTCEDKYLLCLFDDTSSV